MIISNYDKTQVENGKLSTAITMMNIGHEIVLKFIYQLTLDQPTTPIKYNQPISMPLPEEIQ